MANTITIADRLVSVEMDRPAVGGNTYSFGITVDTEWTGNVFVRVRFGSLFYDIPVDLAEDDSVSIQFPINFPEVGIGIYSEALEICTNETRVKLLKSILTSGEEIVEFDDNLYTAWESAMTEYLTDDSFDAESTRPVQNAVITAWKNMVALDSDVVHKAGDELITGIKTFFANPIIENFSLAELLIKSDAASYIAGKKGRIVFNIGSTEAGEIALETALSQNKLTIKEGTAEIGLITDTAAGKSYATAPVADASLTDEGIIVTKGSLVTEPSVVHTSGNETISGLKTFSNRIDIMPSGSSMITLNSSESGTATAIKSDIVFTDVVDGAQATAVRIRQRTYADHNDLWFIVYDPGKTRLSQFRMNAYADHGELMTDAPYYPVDGQGNPQALAVGQYVTSGNVAVDPRIVHTTGNEEIAGNKTFKSAVTSEGGFRWGYNSISMAVSTWMRIYTFEPPSTSTALRLLIQTIRAEAMIQTMNDAIEIYVSTGLNINGSIRSNAGLEGKLALNTTTGKIELWIHRTAGAGTGTMNMYCNFIQARGYRGSMAENVTGSEPIVGDTYTSVVALTVVA